MPRRYFISHTGGPGAGKKHTVRNIKSKRNLKSTVSSLRAHGYSVHKVWRG